MTDMELKARHVVDVYDDYSEHPCEECSQVYLKSEADKVIADLEESHKKEVEQLLILNREQNNAANRLRYSMEQVIRHSKYKRCLVMAKWCCDRWADIATPYGKSVWYRKWHNRWLKCAEKLKEAK